MGGTRVIRNGNSMAEKCRVYSHACTFSKRVGFKAGEKMSRQKVCLGQPASLILIFTQTYVCFMQTKMYHNCGYAVADDDDDGCSSTV